MPHGCPCVVPRASPESRLHHAYLSEHPTWWASTPICCRADSKNSGEGFPTTSASIPQAYWGERRGEATGEGPTCGGGLPLGTQGRSTGTAHRGPGASQGRGACAGRPPAARAGMTPHGAQWDTRGPSPPGTCHLLEHPTVTGGGLQLAGPLASLGHPGPCSHYFPQPPSSVTAPPGKQGPGLQRLSSHPSHLRAGR